MVAEVSYAPRSDVKRELWSMKIDPKIKWLAQAAAQEEGITLSAFVERAIQLLLNLKTTLEYQEPNIIEAVTPSAAPPMWGEGMFDDDPATRFFLKATAFPGSLSVPEQNFFKFYCLHVEHTHQTIRLKTFQEFWNNPSINTSHLSEGEE